LLNWQTMFDLPRSMLYAWVRMKPYPNSHIQIKCKLN
jgi:hypothetical protein